MLILLIVLHFYTTAAQCLMKFNFKEIINPKEMHKCLYYKEEKIVSITQITMLPYAVPMGCLYVNVA